MLFIHNYGNKSNPIYMSLIQEDRWSNNSVEDFFRIRFFFKL